jgi:hypothetical protein
VVVFVPTGHGADGAERLAAAGHRHGESGLAGHPTDIAAGAQAWVEAGATTVVLQPLEGEPDPVEFVRLAGAAVQPAFNDARA